MAKRKRRKGAPRMAELGYVQIQMWLSPSLVAAIDEEVVARGVKRPRLIRDALQFYFENRMFRIKGA